MSESNRLLRLRSALVDARVPEDLFYWVLELAAAAEIEPSEIMTPKQRLALRLSEEIDRWMVRRRVTWRTIGISSQTLARCLKGDNVTLHTIADVADSLGCEAVVEFRSRGIHGSNPAISESSILFESASDETMGPQ